MTAPTRNPNLPRSFVIGGDEPREYCDRHGGYVDEGRTQPYAPGSPYRLCDGCASESATVAPNFHDQCGYAWSEHDNTKPPLLGWVGPFGCPPENAARAAFGDR